MHRASALFVLAACAFLWAPGCGGTVGRPVDTLAESRLQPEVIGLNYLFPVVDSRPPGAPSDPKGPRPSAAHVWRPGYWGWGGAEFTWRSGEWTMPPSPNMAWVRPTWASVDGGYRFRHGEWR